MYIRVHSGSALRSSFKFTNSSGFGKSSIVETIIQARDNRPLSKLAAAREFEGGSEHRTAVYYYVYEDSSTEPTHKLPAAVEFRKRSNVAHANPFHQINQAIATLGHVIQIESNNSPYASSASF